MRVLITGNRGFIGRVLESRLVASGCEVEGFDLIDGLDIGKPELIVKRADGCEAIVHLAAAKNADAAAIMQTNLQGTWNVLCAGAEVRTRKIIFTSSINALGIFQGEGVPEYLPLDDDHPCHPRSSYAISKKLGEEMCRHFTESTGISTMCFRPPGVWDDSTYHEIVVARGKRPEYEWDPYWEYGAFLDVRDLVDAILLALQKDLKDFHCLLLAASDITTSGKSSLELVREILPRVEWKGGDEYKVDPYRSLIDCGNAQRLLGWIPQYSWNRFLKSESARRPPCRPDKHRRAWRSR